jgi:hypothetical protein
MKDRVDVDESVIMKNGNLWPAVRVAGRGHWFDKDDTEVAGVEGEDASSRSSSDW